MAVTVQLIMIAHWRQPAAAIIAVQPARRIHIAAVPVQVAAQALLAVAADHLVVVAEETSHETYISSTVDPTRRLLVL